ncbi:MAG: glycosyltransferase family 39 protein [Pseudomonadota bacterium]|nr:glycosyltransferase family 39 protein [Pseudomonadota bacterium]MDE3037332.1 glycosyltransferase family 39 protein [Pseudomonadota bacterium]
MQNKAHAVRRDMTWVFLAALIFFCIGLGARPYLTPSEARYIEVPRQMLATHDWLTPRINGVPYFEKPPLFYWMQASVMQFLGAGEFAGRITTAIMAALLCTITFAAGRMLYGRPAGLQAALVLATCAFGYTLSRVAMVDMPVSLFITACLACFMAAQHTEGKRKRNFYLLMYPAAALAVLSKGLIGMVIPGLVISAWIATTKSWRILREARLFTGLVIFLIIAVPWHVLMMRAHPAFFDFYIVHEHFERFLTNEAKRDKPWWFFIAITLAGLLPWTFTAPHSLRGLVTWKETPQSPFAKATADKQVRGDTFFLLLWILLPLLFFSASHSKLAAYILPIFPPLCIAIGKYLAEAWQGQVTAQPLRRNIFFVAALFGALLAAYGVLHYIMPLPGGEDRKLAVGRDILPWMLIPLTLALIGLLHVALRRYSAKVLIMALALFGAVVGLSANYIVGDVDRASARPLADFLKDRLKPGDMLVMYGGYFQDVPVYLNRNVSVAGYTGELEFGYAHYPETHEWMITDKEFWRRCANAKHPVYALMKNTTRDTLKMPAACRLREVASYGRNVLLEKE